MGLSVPLEFEYYDAAFVIIFDFMRWEMMMMMKKQVKSSKKRMMLMQGLERKRVMSA